ncbi:MCE family protein [Oscillatoriales cyanobacterium LEGE 11467]|uniref:MCE family protein n=2 Tax=Zarconia TaxID=2992130 RepID=A0A928Z8F3_9CYAN|nr:MCE family protein [Zarconia navalis LEGE 11467]
MSLFTLLFLWLQGVNLGRRSYQFIIQFGDVLGVQTGSIVRYRGVAVGKVTAVVPGSEGVDVTVEISSPDMVLPRDVTIEANQGGLISESTVDMTPIPTFPDDGALNIDNVAGPMSPDCNSNIIICENDRLPGEMGVSFSQLARSSIAFTKAFSNPEFVAKLATLTENSATAAAGVAELTEDLSVLSNTLEQELGVLSDYAIATTDTVGSAANQLSLTANEISRLALSVNSLVDDNRTSLVSTLDNIDRLGQELRLAAGNLTPLFDSAGQTLERAGQTFDRAGQTFDSAGQTLARVEGELNNFDSAAIVGNLEEITNNAIVLSQNAAIASNNLRQASEVVNDPTNIVLLEETLDSARATFQNVRKITSDLDDLTGDPAFRDNIRRLVNGLSGLVSSTEQLQQQVRTAQTLEPLETSITQIESATSQSNPNANLKKRPIVDRDLDTPLERSSSLKKYRESNRDTEN